MAALPIWASVPTVRPPAPECPAALAKAAAPHTGFEVQKCQQCAILVSAVDELAFPLNKRGDAHDERRACVIAGISSVGC